MQWHRAVVAGSDGDPFSIEKIRQIVCMPAVDHQTEDRSFVLDIWAQDADSRDFAQSFMSVDR